MKQVINPEDAAVLKYMGLMGHPIAAVAGEAGKRVSRGEFNTLPEARKYIPDATLCVYERGSRKQYRLVYDRAANAVGEAARSQWKELETGPLTTQEK